MYTFEDFWEKFRKQFVQKYLIKNMELIPGEMELLRSEKS